MADALIVLLRVAADAQPVNHVTSKALAEVAACGY
jgi:hypothetical protein